MALVKLKQKGQMTLPAEIRAALSLKEGNLLEADIKDGKVFLSPKTIVDRDRPEAFARMADISKQARESWEADGITEEEIDQIVTETVEEVRAARRQRNVQST